MLIRSFIFLIVLVIPGQTHAQRYKWAVGMNGVFWREKHISSLSLSYTGKGGGVFLDFGGGPIGRMNYEKGSGFDGPGFHKEGDYPVDPVWAYDRTRLESNFKGYVVRLGGYFVWGISVPKLNPTVAVDVTYLNMSDHYSEKYEPTKWYPHLSSVDHEGRYDFWALAFGLRPGVQYNFSQRFFGEASVGIVFYLPYHTVSGAVPETGFQPKYGPRSQFEQSVGEVKLGCGYRF